MLCPTCTTWRDGGTNPEPVLPFTSVQWRLFRVEAGAKPDPVADDRGRGAVECYCSRPVPRAHRWTLP
jgi:hypothetical protein